MKKSLFVLLSALVFCTGSTHATNFEPGDALTVFATSGLKLRMEPGLSSESVLVIPFGDEVLVMNTFDFSEDYADRINWMEGHWILVDYYGMQGYVFDGYLSNLPLPDHESELCGDCYHIVFPLDQYLDDHFPVETSMEPTNQSEVINQFVDELDSKILRKRSFAEGWFHLEVTMENVRMGEVLNLLRSMLVNKDMKTEFDRSLVFQTDGSGKVNAIQIKMYENPIRITSTKDGKVKLSSTAIHRSEDGC